MAWICMSQVVSAIHSDSHRNSQLFSTKLPSSAHGTNLLATRKHRFILMFVTLNFKHTHCKLTLVVNSIIHSAVRLTTGPHPPPKPVLHTVRSSASFFFSIYSILSYHSGHPIAAYVFFLVFPSPLSFLKWRVLADSSCARCDKSSHHNFLILYAIYFSSPDSTQYLSISHTIGPDTLLNPPPSPYFRISQVFPIYLRGQMLIQN